MTIAEFQDILRLNQLANEWIQEYIDYDIGLFTSKFKKQYQIVAALKQKTEALMEQHIGAIDVSKETGDTLFQEIQLEAEKDPLFASCFESETVFLPPNTNVSKEQLRLSFILHNLISAWLAKETNPNTQHLRIIQNLHEQTERVAKAPKTSSGDDSEYVVRFYSVDNRPGRNMRKHMLYLQNKLSGLAEIEIIEQYDQTDLKAYEITTLPALVFLNNGKNAGVQQGILSLSAIQQKVNLLLDGQTHIGSKNHGKKLKGLKTVTPRELAEIGERLVFLFTRRGNAIGVCEDTARSMDRLGAEFQKKGIKYEHIVIDGTHSLHHSLKVTAVPGIVFVDKGRTSAVYEGKREYDVLRGLMEDFATSEMHSLRELPPAPRFILPIPKSNIAQIRAYNSSTPAGTEAFENITDFAGGMVVDEEGQSGKN